MKKIYYLLLFVFIFALKAHTQVTIGSLAAPERGSLLELRNDTLGFLPTRVTLSQPSNPYPLPTHVQGMLVFNLATTDSLSVGLYYNTGSRWVRFSTSPYTTQKWFFMPSIIFDTSTNGTNLQKNLYDEFVTQLNTDSPTDFVINSTGAPGKVLTTVPSRTDLYYYVTAYDDKVFQNISINANGLMNYDIISQASDSTLINIVFVEK